MPTIVCAHEPGVGFAADAYARLKGLGVALVTYGPGALNTLNPVACAYAEQSPLLVVSGGPEVAMRRPELHLHHVVKTFESQLQIYREVTVDAAVLDDAESAPETIDRVLRNVVKWKRPGYLEIPRDRVHLPVADPVGGLELSPSGEISATLAGALDEVTAEIGAMLETAEPARALCRRPGPPARTDRRGRAPGRAVADPGRHGPPWQGIVSREPPTVRGHLSWRSGRPVIRALLDESDCVLGIGVMLTDLGTGFWTQRIDPKARDHDRPGPRSCEVPPLRRASDREVVTALLDRLPASERPAPRFDSGATAEYPIVSTPPPVVSQVDPQPVSPGVIQIADVIAALKSLDQSRYSFVADVGDSWFVGLELRADVFLAAGYYSSMGFAVPAALGVGIAEPSRRPLAIVGDGAFQMTGTELSTLVDQGLRPIVLLLNNGGYGMLEAIDGPRPYYERRNWDYPAFARALGAQSERVSTAAQLREALQRAEAARVAYLIEALTARDDLSPVMSRIQNYLRASWQHPGRPLNAGKNLWRIHFLIGSGILGDVLDGYHRLDLASTDFGHRFFPECDAVMAAENVLGGRGEYQP